MILLSAKRPMTEYREVQKIRTSEEMGVKHMQKWEERVYDRMDGKEEGQVEKFYKTEKCQWN